MMKEQQMRFVFVVVFLLVEIEASPDFSAQPIPYSTNARNYIILGFLTQEIHCNYASDHALFKKINKAFSLMRQTNIYVTTIFITHPRC